MAVNALPADDERTVFQPEPSQPVTDGPVPPPRHGRSGLPAGTLLNNIYAVHRFLARGGMGEVYEGINVNTDERVAIKVMLPHLAADPKVQAMFRKEARILTELAHPALVRYRVLAHEPHLELFYIVTEFIDGQSLSEVLGELRPTVDQLKALIRRLAEGLAAAHAMGATHRDMSPDNVLLPHGRLDQAKIIDFGIARETSLAHQTVVGEGFAGKLGYVAPEQFGDFGRRIGPWTDIYSLGLVGLALASERAPDMGVTLVDAVDRRRQGVDLGGAPAVLRPIFEKMLAPDPSHRFQTMAEVIAAIDAVGQPAPAPVAAPARPATIPPVAATPAPAAEPPSPVLTAVETDDAADPSPPRSMKGWLLGAAALAVAAGAIAVVIGMSGPPKPKAGPLDNVVPIAPLAGQPQIPEASPLPAEPETATVEALPETPAPAATQPLVPPPKSKRQVPATKAREVVLPPTAVIAAPQVAAAAPIAVPVPAEAAAPVAEKGVEACWRAVGGDWSYIGYASRSSCAAQAFNSCQVVHGRWGKTPLRRYDGKLQAKGGGLIPKWQSIGTSQCPSALTAPTP